MDRFFNMDNKFFTFMSRVADLIILNLLCIVCCIPVVTIGPSIAAMFYVTLKMVRNEESYIVRGFCCTLTLASAAAHLAPSVRFLWYYL